MKKDSLRAYLEKAAEAYRVGREAMAVDYKKFGPRIVKRQLRNPDGVKPEDREPVRIKEDEPLSENRRTCLEIGIDVKYIVIDFMDSLKEDHGERRCERFKKYLLNTDISQMPYKLRYQIKSDAKRLNMRITRYRIDGEIL